jgi:dihydroorotase
MRGEELSEIGDMKFAGAVAVSDDGKPVSNPSMMKKALLYSRVFDMPVISHCEDLDLADGGDMNEGFTSLELGLRGVPSIAESVQVARDVLISEYTGVPVHIAHVSTESSVAIIRNAKKRGVNITCETCPHYFTLTDTACRGYDTNAKVNPPLAQRADVEAVRAGLADGTIDIIATDHAPHHIDEKNVEFSKAANGFAGFETAFGLAYTYLVLPGILTLGQLAHKMSAAPAALFRLDAVGAGAIAAGKPANLTIVDLEREWVVEPGQFSSKSKNSPFGGYILKGAAVYTIVDGKAVVRQRVLTG